MSEEVRGFARLWKFFKSWKLPAAVAMALLVLFLAWLIPRPPARPGQAWDTSHWQAFTAVWQQAAALTLVLVAVLLAMFMGSSRIAEKAAAARFFFISFILHVLAVVLMLYIPLAEQVIERAEEIRVEARRALDDELRADPDRVQQAFEKVADLQSPEKVEPAEISRQLKSRPQAPADAPSPTIRPEMARTLPANRLLFVPPAAEPVPESPPVVELERRNVAPPRMVETEIELESPPAPAELPAERPLDPSVAVARQEPIAALPESNTPPLPLRVSARLPAQAAIIEPEETDVPPTAVEETGALPRMAAGQGPAADMPAEVVTPIAAAAPQGESPLEVQDVVGVQRQPSEQPSPRQVSIPVPRVANLTSRSIKASEPAIELVNDEESPAIGRAMAATPVAVAEPLVAATPAMVEPSTPVPEQIEAPETNLTRQSVDKPASDVVAAVTQPAVVLTVAAARPTAENPVEATVQQTPTAVSAPPLARAEVGNAPSAETAMEAVEIGTPAPVAMAQESPDGLSEDGAATQLARLDPLLLEAAELKIGEIAKSSEIAGQAQSMEPVLAGASQQSPADLPAPASLPIPVDRLPFDAAPVAYADDSVALTAMFTLRQGDVRREFIELFGGTPESEEAVRRGLSWVAQHQEEDGHWSLNQFNVRCKDHPQCNGHGSAQSDTAATGFALLPFLGAGHTHQTGDHQAVIGKALRWLVAQQKPDGDLHTGPPGNVRMYGHGIASIALCEAYGLTQDPELRAAAQRSLDFIVAAQHQSTGGWRYHPGEPGDTSVVGWQVMALKSGEMAGLPVPPRSLELAAVWLKSVEASGDQIGRFGYQGPGASPAMTAEALLCRQFLGVRRDDPSMQAGAKFLLTQLPRQGQESSYYWYYSTQVMYHMQAEYWETWNASLRDTLVSTQLKDGPMAGTWNPTDQWEGPGGRLYSTAMRLLMLEIYYRHLPLYRQLDE